MQMVHGLAGVIAAVEDSAEAGTRDSELWSNMLGGHEEVLKDMGVFQLHIEHVFDVFLGNDENVYGGLRTNVFESHHAIVFENFFTRQGALNDFAENTFFRLVAIARRHNPALRRTKQRGPKHHTAFHEAGKNQSEPIRLQPLEERV